MNTNTRYWFVLIIIFLVLYAGLMSVAIVAETSTSSHEDTNGSLITISTVTPHVETSE